jgi:hypothetical protein
MNSLEKKEECIAKKISLHILSIYEYSEKILQYQKGLTKI